jgi:hypothetical protein
MFKNYRKKATKNTILAIFLQQNVPHKGDLPSKFHIKPPTLQLPANFHISLFPGKLTKYILAQKIPFQKPVYAGQYLC